MNSYALFMTRWTMQQLRFQGYECATKMIYGLGQLLITFTSMIAHGHRDEKYAQYSNELWPMIPNNPNSQLGPCCDSCEL